MTLVATAVTTTAPAVVFDARRWPTYLAPNILIGLTYALAGALLAPIFGLVAGVFVAFLLPFLDRGAVQSPMLHPDPTAPSRLLPASVPPGASSPARSRPVSTRHFPCSPDSGGSSCSAPPSRLRTGPATVRGTCH
jgi:hypothetical protein